MAMTVPSLLAVLLAGSVALLPARAQELPQAPYQPATTSPVAADDDYGLALKATQANDPAEALSRYLRVMARDPHNLDALTGAGKAALDIGDANAAATFYARAQELAPGNPRIKAGLGSAMVQLMQPRAALKLFDAAVSLGVPIGDIASDRGLAYDLRGDNRKARADHELAFRLHPTPETIRRYAASQAIGGDSLGAMATLDGLLRKKDKAAWRMRAFVLAIGGDVTGADQSARSVLSKQQADALQPFLNRLGKLRPEQQAAAIHFGRFPSDGHEYSETELAGAAGISAPAPPVSSTLSRAQDKAQKARDMLADDQGDGIESGPRPLSGTIKERYRLPNVLFPETDASRARQKEIDKAKEDAAAARAAEKKAEQEQREADKKAAKEARDADKAKQADKAKLADKADKAKNSKDKDAKAAKDPKADKADKDKDKDAKTDKDKASGTPRKGERFWVRIATGAYKPDLGKEWTRLKTKYPALLGRFTPSTTPLNRTNRLIVGPFKTDDEAQAFVNKASGMGFGTSRVSTSAGQAVERIAN